MQKIQIQKNMNTKKCKFKFKYKIMLGQRNNKFEDTLEALTLLPPNEMF